MRPLKGEQAGVDALLEEWARWVREGTAHLGWPRITLLGRMIEQGFTGAAQTGAMVEMPDSILAVEREVCHLKPLHKRVICKHYLYWQPVEAAARYCQLSAIQYRVTLHRARNTISLNLGLGTLMPLIQPVVYLAPERPKIRCFVRDRMLAL